MPYLRYLFFDFFGGTFWVGAMILGGYSLGHFIPNIGKYIHYVIAVVVLVSILPAVIGLLRSRNTSATPPGTAVLNHKVK